MAKKDNGDGFLSNQKTDTPSEVSVFVFYVFASHVLLLSIALSHLWQM